MTTSCGPRRSCAATGTNDGRRGSIVGDQRGGRVPGGHEHRSVRPRADESSKPRDEMAVSDILREQLLALIAGTVPTCRSTPPWRTSRTTQSTGCRPTFPTRPGTCTPWHVLEHIRIAQRDILEYIR